MSEDNLPKVTPMNSGRTPPRSRCAILIYRLWKHEDIKQDEMARRLKIPQGELSEYIRSHRLPSVEMMERINKAFDHPWKDDEILEACENDVQERAKWQQQGRKLGGRRSARTKAKAQATIGTIVAEHPVTPPGERAEAFVRRAFGLDGRTPLNGQVGQISLSKLAEALTELLS